jgi:hypothetical protein
MKKKLKDLSRNDIIIKWADQLIFHSNHLGVINKNSLIIDAYLIPEEIAIFNANEEGRIRAYVLSTIGIDINDVNKYARDFTEYLTGVKNHLLANRYIQTPTAPNFEWILSEIGWKAKELKGHFKYQKYRRREIKVYQNQQTNTILLIIATALAAIMPFVVAHFYSPNITVNVPPQNQLPTHSDSVLLRHFVEEYQRSIKSNPKPKEAIKEQHPRSATH